MSHTTSTLEYEFTGLGDGNVYQFKVEAVNDIGTGEASDVVSFVAASIPAAPSTPTFETATKTTLSIAWNPPSDTGGSDILGYMVYINDLQTEEFKLAYDGSSSPLIVTLTLTTEKHGIITGGFYRLKVSSVNRVGEGP